MLKIFLLIFSFCLTNINSVFARTLEEDKEQYELISGIDFFYVDFETYQDYLNMGKSYSDIRKYIQKYLNYQKEEKGLIGNKEYYLKFYSNLKENFKVYLKYISEVEKLNKKFDDAISDLNKLGYDRYTTSTKRQNLIEKADYAIKEFEDIISDNEVKDMQISELDDKLKKSSKLINDFVQDISKEKQDVVKKQKEAEERQRQINEAEKKWIAEHPEEYRKIREQEQKKSELLNTMGGRICSNFATIMNVIVGHRRNGTPINIAYKMIESTYSHGAEAYIFMRESVKLTYENPDRMEQILDDNSWLTLCAETLNGF